VLIVWSYTIDVFTFTRRIGVMCAPSPERREMSASQARRRA